jgi:hypothetical protein
MSVEGRPTMAASERTHPMRHLSDDELEFVQQLVLASGSLKELAAHYGVSYPTLRGRLDKLIAKVRDLQRGRAPDPMAEMLATYVERGDLGPAAARSILDLHRRERDRPKGD